MGYFRPRIRRHRCAAHVAAAVARQLRADLSPWLTAPPSPPPRPAGRATYLRFAVCRTDLDSHEQLGVFQAAYQLRHARPLHRRDLRRLKDAMDWFGRNLVAPKMDLGRAVFWFRADAGACIGQVWELIRLSNRYEETVWMMRSDWPGRVVYRDEFQVAAVPFRDRPWRSRPVTGARSGRSP